MKPKLEYIGDAILNLLCDLDLGEVPCRGGEGVGGVCNLDTWTSLLYAQKLRIFLPTFDPVTYEGHTKYTAKYWLFAWCIIAITGYHLTVTC